jgi:hypothetical protein
MSWAEAWEIVGLVDAGFLAGILFYILGVVATIFLQSGDKLL